ncbi:MAG: cell division protein FtsZ [Rickettsiaceae bacterium]
MGLDIKAPEHIILKPTITVFGIGGAGGNAVNNMIKANLQGANFVVANTDAQALKHSECTNKIQLGVTSTKGLGAGASPDVGNVAALESEKDIRSHLEGSNMVFITGGMGGGTGTGASPIIAGIAKELGILTVGVVTKPFLFEGPKRMRIADSGLLELQNQVDTLIVIPNQNLFRIANENTTFQQAFEMADEVLHAGVRGITDLITSPGLVNLDFADIQTVMSEKGKAMMGTGEAEGEERAIKAAEAAIANPLLDQNSMFGASGVLINITGGKDMTLYEVDSAANRIREEVGDSDANIIFGSTFNPDLEGKIRVSVVATGIEQGKMSQFKSEDTSIDIEPTQEAVDSVDQTSNASSETNEDDDQPPAYDEYGHSTIIQQSDNSGQLEWTQHSHQEPENDILLARKNINKAKPSLLKRMWNSLKANDLGGETSYNQEVKKNIPSDATTSIREKPDFLRKE